MVFLIHTELRCTVSHTSDIPYFGTLWNTPAHSVHNASLDICTTKPIKLQEQFQCLIHQHYATRGFISGRDFASMTSPWMHFLMGNLLTGANFMGAKGKTGVRADVVRTVGEAWRYLHRRGRLPLKFGTGNDGQ